MPVGRWVNPAEGWGGGGRRGGSCPLTTTALTTTTGIGSSDTMQDNEEGFPALPF